MMNRWPPAISDEKSVSPLASAFYITNLVLPMLLLRQAPDEYAPVELRFHIVATIDVSKTRGVFEFDILLDNHQRYCVGDLCGF